MNQQEITQCRQAAHLFRKVQEENKRLREELEELKRPQPFLSAEDAELFAMVNHGKPIPPSTPSPSYAKLFDFDQAEIEEVEGELVEYIDAEPITCTSTIDVVYIIKFIIFFIIGCGIWTAHHFDYIDLAVALSLTLFLFIFANIMRLF